MSGNSLDPSAAPPPHETWGAGIYSADSQVSIHRCRILDNFGATHGGGLHDRVAAAAQGVVITNTVIAGNSALNGGGIHHMLVSTITADNIVVTGNTASGNSAAYWGDGSHFRAWNSIFWGQGANQMHEGPLMFLVDVNYCDVEGGHAGPGNIDADPLFVSPTTHDYHLSLGSPCIGAGSTQAPEMPSADFEGDPRPMYGAPDMGADEVSNIALHPAMAGTVGVPGAGPYDVLAINGNAGGLSRTASMLAGTPFSIDMTTPPTHPGSAPFAIFGLLRAALPSDAIILPFGIGEMVFPPCPLIPVLEPLLFTLTNNAGTSPCTEVLPSTPTPWTSGVLPGIPFPITVTFQGVVEETPGVWRTTNGIILEVR